jgi:hypothetical protein
MLGTDSRDLVMVLVHNYQQSTVISSKLINTDMSTEKGDVGVNPRSFFVGVEWILGLGTRPHK